MTDFIVANFSGTGTLTGYTPDTGSAFKSTSTDNVMVGSTYNHGLSNTAMLAYMTRLSPGDLRHINTNPWGSNFFLDSPTSVPTPDHYMETLVNLDAAQTMNIYVAHCHRGIRGTAGEAGWFDTIGLTFNVEESDHTHRDVTVYADDMNDRSVAPSIGYGTPVTPNPSALNIGAASSVLLRSEIEGNTLRAFVNGTLVYSNTFTDAGYFAAAGKCAWCFQFSAGATYSLEAIGSLKGGDAFIVIVPPSGAFWQDFTKSVETEEAMLMRAAARTPAIIVPRRRIELPPPPPVVTPFTVDYFRDTFGGGAGVMAGRTPEVGAAYTGSNLSSAPIDVDGFLSFWSTGEARSVVTVPSPPYVLEAKIQFVTFPSSGQTFQFELGLDCAATSFQRIRFLVYHPSTTMVMYGAVIDAGGSIVYSFSNASPGIFVGIDYVLRIEVNSTTIRWLLDGVQMGIFSTSLATFLRVYFYPQKAGIGVGKVDYVASSTPAPPTPPVWWQDYRETVETAE